MKKQHFSLVELLTVIAVIAILAGILIPTVGAVKESGRATQALTEAKGIHLAIKSFQNDHKYLPSKDATSGTLKGGMEGGASKDIVYWGSVAAATPDAVDAKTIKENAALDTSYLALFDRICYVEQTDISKKPSEFAGDQKDFNKKAKKYLTAPNSYFASDSTIAGYRDPWGRPYIIYLDTNYDGKIEGIAAKFGATGNQVNDTVAVISLGKTTVPANGIAVNSADIDSEDLCTSWQ